MSKFPGRLYHQTPGWVQEGAAFHLRIRTSPEMHALTQPDTAGALLETARHYHDLGHWWCTLFLLMPDHAHTTVSFPPAAKMSTTVMNFKRATGRFLEVRWQGGYFDHRLRTPEEARETWDYIRRNPVVKGL
jgi:putative transposase